MNRFRGRRRTTKCSTTVKSNKAESMVSEFTDSLLILIFSLREKHFELSRTCVLVQVLDTLTTSEASSLLFLLVFGTRFPRIFVYAYFKVRPELLYNNKLFRKIIFRKFDTRPDPTVNYRTCCLTDEDVFSPKSIDLVNEVDVYVQTR